MAPSTDQLLHYILVNAALVSAVLLLACAYCKKFRTKKVTLIKNREERLKSELKRVTVVSDNGIRETNGIKHGAISTDTALNSEEKEGENNVSPTLKSGMVQGSEKREPSKTSLNLMHRVLPPPPENIEATPPAPEVEDPLYDSVKEMKERLVEMQEDNALSNNKDVKSISKTNNTISPENQGPQKLERINPLYVSADELNDSPSYNKPTSNLPNSEVKDEDSMTRVVNEPLYAVIRKNTSVKKTPPQNPGEKSNAKDSALQKVVLPEKLDSDDQTVITSMEQKPPYQSPSEKVDSMLLRLKMRGIKSAHLPSEDTAGNVGQEVPPMVPVKRFDIEDEIIHTAEEDTELAGELPTGT